MKRRIFLSYGHDEHVGIARKLKSDFEARGHEVWFDEERLKPGADWETSIERGLDWAVSAPERGRIVLLMTPHSVRRPDGYCLNELARALSRGLPVVPIMLVWAEPPLSICRIQFLDLRDCVPIEARPAIYESKFGRLIRAVEEDEIDFDGVQARLMSFLDPLPFDAEMNEHLVRFVGRDWILQTLNEWLADPAAEKVFWITGHPGAGKTALCAKLAATRPEIVAVHLCRFGHAQKSDARRCIMSLAYQLSTQLPAYEERLNALPLHTIVPESDAQTLFDRLIVQPLSAQFPDPGRKVIVLIDALDEATRDGRNPLAALLAEAFRRTPPWLRLVVTSRPSPEVMHVFQAMTARAIDMTSPDNAADLRTFVRRELHAQLADAANSDSVVETIVKLSEGNFLYLECLRREVVAGRIALTKIADLPRGLGGIYAQFAARQWPDVAAFRDEISAALDIMAAAREPLPLGELAAMRGWNERQQRDFVTVLGSLFTVNEGRIIPFHKSLFDWLTDPDCAGPYFVRAAEGERLLAAHCWRQFQQTPHALPDYALRQLPTHLLADKNWDALEALLTDLAYLEARTERSTVFALAADFGSVLAALPRSRPRHRLLQLIDQAVRREQHFIARHPTTLFQCLWNVCWWHDAPGAAHQSGQGAGLFERVRKLMPSWTNRSAPTPSAGAPLLRELMERWRREKAARQPEFVWVRSLRPPALPLSVAHTVLGGHTDVVGHVSVSTDAARLLSGSGDGTCRLWDARTGVQLLSMRGQFAATAMSPDARLIATVSEQAVELRDVGAGETIKELRPQQAGLCCVAFSPDGRCVAVGSRGGVVTLWDVQSGGQIALLREDGGRLQSVAFSPDGTTVLTGHEVPGAKSGYALLWEWRSERAKRSVQLHGTAETAFRFSPDGVRFAVGVGSGPPDYVDMIKVWTVAGEHEPVSLKHAGLTDIGFSPDGTKLVSCGNDYAIRVWDVARSALLSEAKFAVRPFRVGYLADGRIYSTMDDCAVRIWDDLPHLSAPHSENAPDLLAYTSDGKTLVRTTWEGELDFWDAATGRRLGASQRLKGAPIDMVLSPNGRQLAVAVRNTPLHYDASAPDIERYSTYLVQIFGVPGRTLLYTFPGFWKLDARCATKIRYTSDGNTLAVLFDGDGPTVALNARRLGKAERLSEANAAALHRQLQEKSEAGAGSIEVQGRGGEVVFVCRQSGRELAWYSAPLLQLASHPAGRMWAGGVGHRLEMIAVEGAEATG